MMAVCIAPMMCALWLRLKRGDRRPNPIIRFVKGIYVPVLWGVGAAFVMILVHGLVDSPYWKNDLSLEFWLLAALEMVALRALAQPVQTTPATPAGPPRRL